ncbi:MAG TPA: DNA polymerase III subunit delta' [Anaerolineales bacterium]|nr:DNA polymerase III subunit delta' [Anaerolineales bacterium]
MTGNWNLIGHEWAVDMLKKHVVNGTTRHAYLFAGPPGLGRRTLALRFAQALNCQTPIEAGVACGQCRDCRQIEAMQHADLNVIEPLIKAPDNSEKYILGPNGEKFIPSPNGVIRIFQIRELQKTVNYRPYQSHYRILIFLRFQQANDEAANALLKTLEEAPSYAVLILTADNPEQLLPTIVSRCEVLRLRPLRIQEVQQALEERGFEANQSKWIAHISGGRFGYARRLIGSEALLVEREERLNDLQSLMSASRVQKFAYADRLSKDKESMRQALLIWLSYWRDVMLRAAQAGTPLVNVDRNLEIEDIASRMDLSSARLVVRGLENTLEKMDGNVNPRLLAEVLLLDLPRL